MKCIITGTEIEESECENTIRESYKEKNGKELAKKFKRIHLWKVICRECKYHKMPDADK